MSGVQHAIEEVTLGEEELYTHLCLHMHKMYLRGSQET